MYVTNDLLLKLPADDIQQDMSTNVLRLSKKDTTLAIGRGYLDENGTLKSTIEQQFNTLKQQGWICGELEKTTIGADKNITVYESEVKHIINDIPIYQLQVYFQLPDTNKMLSVSYGKYSAPFNEQDKTYWQEVKNNLSFPEQG